MRCDRCEQPSSSYRMSFFNTDTICPACQAIEEAHPDYPAAKQAEFEACQRGDLNFPGVGWPGEHGRLGDRALKHRAIACLVFGALYWYITTFIDTAFAVGAL